MTRTLLLFLTLCSCAPAPGQIDYFVPGRIRLVEGSYRSGFVNYDRDGLLSQRVRFRSNLNDTVQTLSATRILEVELTESGRIFQQLDQTFTSAADGATYTVKRLAELLFDGAYALHRLPRESLEVSNDPRLPPQVFYLTDGDRSTRLDILLFQDRLGDDRMLRKYRNVLLTALADWPAAARRIADLPYREEALIRLLRDYTDFVRPNSQPYEVRREAVRGSVRHGPRASVIGLAFNDNPANFNFGLGLGYAAEFFSPRLGNSLSVTLAAEATYYDYDAGSGPGTAYVDRKGSLHFPLGLNYYLNRNARVQPYFRVILAPTLLELGGQRLVQRGMIGRTRLVDQSFSFRSFRFSLGLGGGVQFGRWAVNLNAIRNIGLQATGVYYWGE